MCGIIFYNLRNQESENGVSELSLEKGKTR